MSNIFEVEGLVLMYDNKFFKHPGMMKTHWLGPYVGKEIINGRAIKLEKITWDRCQRNRQ